MVQNCYKGFDCLLNCVILQLFRYLEVAVSIEILQDWTRLVLKHGTWRGGRLDVSIWPEYLSLNWVSWMGEGRRQDGWSRNL